MTRVILRAIMLCVLALILGLSWGKVKANCTPTLTRAEHVFAFKGAETALLVFAFVDKDCDGQADEVFIYRYLGRYNGEHLFELLDTTGTAHAEEVLDQWRELTKAKGRAC